MAHCTETGTHTTTDFFKIAKPPILNKKTGRYEVDIICTVKFPKSGTAVQIFINWQNRYTVRYFDIDTNETISTTSYPSKDWATMEFNEVVNRGGV